MKQSNFKAKSYAQLKAEKAAQLKKKEEHITSILTSAKNNPKFVKMLVYSLNSIEALITPPNFEIRTNAKLIIKQGGIGILKELAIANIKNEEVTNLIADIMWKLMSVYDVVDQELALAFAEQGGHEAVINMILQKDKGKATLPLLKILNGLAQVPQLIPKLLNSGIAEAIKLINDLYGDDINIIAMNFDTMKKISNQKTGREFLAQKGLVPSILANLKKCAEANNITGVLNGLSVLDNICRNDDGKNAVKNSDGLRVISDVLSKYSNNDKVLSKGAKIFGKICTEEDMRQQLKTLSELGKKCEVDPSLGNLGELKVPLSLVSNLMLVEDLGRVACEPDNFLELIRLYNQHYAIDLSNKDEKYLEKYESNMKDFMDVFKRLLGYMPDCYDKSSERGQICEENSLFKNLEDSVRKIYANLRQNVEKLETNKDPEGYVEMIKDGFCNFFTSYGDLISQNYSSFPDSEKTRQSWLELLEHIVNDIIVNGTAFFGVDDKANFSASKILRVADDVIERFPEIKTRLPGGILKCFPYIKGVVKVNENWQTLSNDLDVVYNAINRQDDVDKTPIKNDLIPVIVNFMETKPKFRYPNLVNLKILDNYLTDDYVNQYLVKPDPKINPTFSLNYVKAITSVMVKAFYDSSTVLKVVEGAQENEKDDNEEDKEEIDGETEKKITDLGAELLKRLTPLQEYLRQLKTFKKNAGAFRPDTSKSEEILALEDNLVYQNCAMNVKDFFNAGMNDVFLTLRDLIRKEINFIEGFKRLKSNESNPKYKEICDASNKRLRLELGTLRKLEDAAISNFTETQDQKFADLTRDIIDLNNEIIEKSSDSKNLIEHLENLRKNVPFLKENDENLLSPTNANDTGPIDKYINSLMTLFRKQINDEDLCDAVIKTLIALGVSKPSVCNLLVKGGCPRLLLQVMDNTQRNELARDAVELLKMITLSNQENLMMVASQNILPKLFEIRAKFATDDQITTSVDQIANEIMKLPGQDKFAAEMIRNAIKEFHENMQKYNDFKDPEVKLKILGNVEVINAFTTNKKQIEPLLEREFINDLNKAVDITHKDEEISQNVQKLLTNEMSILKKIKDNVESKGDGRHKDVTDDTLKVMLHKSNYVEPFLQTCRIIGDYVKDDDSFNKFLAGKCDEKFVEQLLEIQDNYLDNPEVNKEINNILCYLALRSPKLADFIVKMGGLKNVLEELRAVVFLNDEQSKLLKLNGLKMLNSLLNDDRNLEEFIKSHGIDLLNNIIKNEVNISPKSALNLESPSSFYKTLTTINTRTPEQLKEDEQGGTNF